MPLVVETGAGIAGANSYTDLATADGWYSSVGEPVWEALPTEGRERALILASQYVSNQQVYPYAGAKSFFGNALAWPRTDAVRWENGGAVPPDSVPVEVVQATLVAALLAAQNRLPTQLADASAGNREIKRERVEGAVTVDYYHSSEGRFVMQDDVLGQAALAGLGVPDVTGIVIPLLREDALAPHDAGVSRSRAARRGVLFEPASTPAAFGRGMFDAHPLREDSLYARRGGRS